MTINDIIPKEKDILKDETQLWYFTKDQKSKILDYLEKCSIDDLKDVSTMGANYFIPTWYYLLNDYDIAKQLIEKENFNELLILNNKEYREFEGERVNEYGLVKPIVTNLETTLQFTPNNDILLLLKKAGFKFKDNSFSLNNLYRTYEIIKAGVIDFNEDFLIKNNFGVGDTQNSILQKILWSYEIKKDSKNDLVEMALTIKGFVELGCTQNIQYKKLISASKEYVSEEKNYRELIKEHCQELDRVMEKFELGEKMVGLVSRKGNKNKI